MALKNFAPEQMIYEKRSPVTEMSVVIKGKVHMLVGTQQLTMEAGSVIGVGENPGGMHQFSYKAATDCSIYSYAYSKPQDLYDMITENVKLAPTITMHMVSYCVTLHKLSDDLHKKALNEYEGMLSDLEKYPELCAKTGTKTDDFEYLREIISPDTPHSIPQWQVDFFESLDQNKSLVTPMYSLGSDTCIGILVHVFSFLQELTRDLEQILFSLDVFHEETAHFRLIMDQLTRENNAIESGTKDMEMPSMEGMLEYICMYGEVDTERSTNLAQTMDSFLAFSDRSDTSDALRSVRRKLSEHYYSIYKSVLLKTFDDPHPPAMAEMFLMFGIMDERLATQEDMELLYGFYCSYKFEADSRILTIAEWLKKVYNKEVDPSLNEFQQDFPTYLRECKQNGEISQDEMDRLLEDNEARLDYEIKNLFTLGNRMTYGRISTSVPVFDSQATMLPLEKSHLSKKRLLEELGRIEALDFQIFRREKGYSLPGNESVKLYLHERQAPFMILMPNVGSNMILWQNIEGRVRNSPARMMLPLFFEDNIPDSFTQLCGEYRWEICKTDQGVHWNDITDPSLTAEYNDYLQFYKKNSAFSADMKEKIKVQLKKNQNNFKKVFVSDYTSYIKYEGAGNMRLNKHAREVMFKYCPFKKEVRDRLSSLPQYEHLIENRGNKIEQKIRPMQNIITKAEHNGDEIPTPIVEEIDYLRS